MDVLFQLVHLNLCEVQNIIHKESEKLGGRVLSLAINLSFLQEFFDVMSQHGAVLLICMFVELYDLIYLLNFGL